MSAKTPQNGPDLEKVAIVLGHALEFAQGVGLESFTPLPDADHELAQELGRRFMRIHCQPIPHVVVVEGVAI